MPIVTSAQGYDGRALGAQEDHAASATSAARAVPSRRASIHPNGRGEPAARVGLRRGVTAADRPRSTVRHCLGSEPTRTFASAADHPHSLARGRRQRQLSRTWARARTRARTCACARVRARTRARARARTRVVRAGLEGRGRCGQVQATLQGHGDPQVLTLILEDP